MTLGGEPHNLHRVATNRAHQEIVEEQAHETQANDIPRRDSHSQNSKEDRPPHNPEQIARASGKKTGRQPSRIRRSQDMPSPRAKILLPEDPCQQRHADQRLKKERDPFFHANKPSSKATGAFHRSERGKPRPEQCAPPRRECPTKFWAISAFFHQKFPLEYPACLPREPNLRLLSQSTLLPDPFPPQMSWSYVRQISCVFSFFGIGLVVSPICALLSRCFGSRIPSSTGQRLIRGLFKGWLHFSCRIGVFDISFPEAEQLRDLRGTVLAPNHPSLDRCRHPSFDCSPHRLHHARELDSKVRFSAARRGSRALFPTTRAPRSSGRV